MPRKSVIRKDRNMVLSLHQDNLLENIFFQTMLNTIPIGLFIFEADGKISITNGEAKRIFAGAVSPESIYDFSKYKVCRPETGEPMEPDWLADQVLLHGREIKGAIIEIVCFAGKSTTI